MNRAERRRRQKLAEKATAPGAVVSEGPEALYARANALHDRQDIAGAVALYRKAIEIRPDFAEAHYNLGVALKDGGSPSEAALHFRKAADLLPHMTEPLNNLGTALIEASQPEAAVAAYREAIALQPDDPGTHFNLGVALKALERWEDAIASYRAAVARAPQAAEAHFNLMQIFEITNDVEGLRAAADDAERSCGDDPRIALGKAWLLKRDGDPAAARALLENAREAFSDPVFLAERAYFLGDLCDRADDPDAAFQYFTKGGIHGKEVARTRRIDAARYRSRVDLLTRRFTTGWVDDWRKIAPRDGRPDPVFLVGFPRSGTTLLDTILRSHGAIAVAEEIPAVHAMRSVLQQLPGGEPDGLASLDASSLAALRDAWFAALDKALGADSHPAIVIDKLPLNLVEAGLIHRVFPKARFLFVQRHPCDCVLSCFMQSFQLNDAMANFLDIKESARLYDGVMALWQQLQLVLPLSVHTTRYEDLIADFDGTVSAILDFLQLDWDEGVRDYAETARRRGRINTPSYSQVIQPLYTRAQGRWERYREPMQPALPVLLKWAERFGYPDR